MIQQGAVIKDYKQNEAGAWFIVHVPKWSPKVKLSDQCELWLNDGRTISTDQRKFAHALLEEIRKFHDWTRHQTKATLKHSFVKEYELEYFSLSDIDMSTAKLFIEHLIEYIFLNNVPIKKNHIPMMKESNKFYFMCIVKRTCAVCGRHAEIHHIDTVGMGRNRAKIDHTKHLLIALCPDHHQYGRNAVHNIGWDAFKMLFHVSGIYVDVGTLKKLNIRGEYEQQWEQKKI